MEQILIERERLIEKLKSNRTQHHIQLKEAMTSYRKLVVNELEKMLEKARSGADIKLEIKLKEPTNHSQDYDRAIEMVMWSCEERIMLSQRDFHRYILDEWDWHPGFRALAHRYAHLTKEL